MNDIIQRIYNLLKSERDRLFQERENLNSQIIGMNTAISLVDRIEYEEKQKQKLSHKDILKDEDHA